MKTKHFIIIILGFLCVGGIALVMYTWPERHQRVDPVPEIPQVQPADTGPDLEPPARDPVALEVPDPGPLGGGDEPPDLDMSFLELAEKLQMSTEDLFHELQLPADTDAMKPVIPIIRQYGMTLDDAYERLDGYLWRAASDDEQEAAPATD